MSVDFVAGCRPFASSLVKNHSWNLNGGHSNLLSTKWPLLFFYRYEEKLKERLARRRERLAQGLPPDDDDEEDLEDGLAEGEEVTDVKAILEDLDKRYIED